MIPVERQPEPDDFEDKVRRLGSQFLAENPNPSKWSNSRAYWRNCLQDLWNAYSGVCAYSCHWIPSDVGSSSVDHYLPKSARPDLAYEWRNYRLAAAKLNSRKSDCLDVLDPFEIKAETFILEFPTMLVKPGANLSIEEQRRAKITIDQLKLNTSEDTVNSRLDWILNYCDRLISFNFLERRAPFLAFELRRQGLVEDIRIIFARRRLT